MTLDNQLTIENADVVLDAKTDQTGRIRGVIDSVGADILPVDL